MNVSYEYYRIFYYVAKYRSLTQAAEALHNNQPNLSRVIRLMEGELGCRLMVRSNRGILLTPEGERLYLHVKAAVDQLRTAEEEISASIGMQEGSVTIGASETALCIHVLPVLNQFKKTYSGIHIRILNHLTAQAIDSVKKGVVDFSVVTTPALLEKPLTATPIAGFRDILIGGPSYAAYSGSPMSLSDLSQFPFVCLGESSMTYQLYADFYHSHGLEFRPELEAATTDQILPIIRHDLGIGFVPEIFAREALQNGQVVQLRLKEDIPDRQICFVENEQYPLSIAAGELKRLLIAHPPETGCLPACGSRP